MANSNFVVQNGLTVGPLTIDAATGSITTTGTVNVSGLAVSSISQNDSSISISDTGTGSNVRIIIDGTTEQTIDSNGINIASGDWYAINGTSVLSATTLGSGVTASSLTSVGTLTGLTVSGNTAHTSTVYAQGIYDNANRVLSTSTGAGNLTISGTAVSLTATGPGATTVGGSTAIPIITTDAYGRIVALSTASLSTTSISNGTSNVSVASNGGTTIGVAGANIAAIGSGGITLLSGAYYGTVGTATQNSITTMAGLTSLGTAGVTTTAAGNFTVTGNLTVSGTQNVINSTTYETTEYVVNQNATSGNITTLYTQNFSSGNAVISGGYISAMANVNATVVNGTTTAASTVNTATLNATNGNITNANHTTMVSTNFSSGNIQATSNITLTGSIIPSSNVSSNLGDSTHWFNTFYGVATQAKYADLAENYQADKPYNPGTVLQFGGTQEVTVAEANTPRVAGVVSTNPAHLMNGALAGSGVVALALTGRVPCNVIGPVTKGDMLVSAGFGFARADASPAMGTVIGKALEDFPINGKGVIEVVVGRL